MKNNIKKGFTLTEVLLVLAVAAIIIALVFLTYKKVSNESTEKRMIDSITQVYSVVKNLQEFNIDYSKWTDDDIIKYAASSNSELFDSSGKIKTFPNATLTIVSIGNAQYIALNSYGTIDSDICVNLLTHIQSLTNLGFNINGSSVTKYTPVQIATECSGNPNITGLVPLFITKYN